MKSVEILHALVQGLEVTILSIKPDTRAERSFGNMANLQVGGFGFRGPAALKTSTTSGASFVPRVLGIMVQKVRLRKKGLVNNLFPFQRLVNP